MQHQIVKEPKNKNLVFSSVGDNTNFNYLWTKKYRKYDLWVVYYGDNDKKYEDYKKSVDFIEKRKGSKFQNLYHIFKKYHKEIMKYERFFILDDDIIISTSDINTMFYMSQKYKLWICQPSFAHGSKISWQHTKNVRHAILRYTNFIEVNAPLYTRWALCRLMNYYDERLIGWGVDYLSIWSTGHMYKNTYAVIHTVKCVNPQDTEKPESKRELSKLKNWEKREQDWLGVRKKLRMRNYDRNTVILANEAWHKHHSYNTYRTLWLNNHRPRA